MSEKPAIAVPVVKPMAIELSQNPRGDAIVTSETPGETNVVLVLPMAALSALGAMLGKASAEQAKHQPVQ